MRKHPEPEVPERLLSQRKRDLITWLGVILLLLAVASYVLGLRRVQAGDFQVLVQMASQSEYTEHISNMWLNASFVFFIGGLVCVAYSLGSKIKKASSDHGESKADAHT